MKWKKIAIVITAILGILTLSGMGWATMDYLGIRPVLKSEFDDLGRKIEVVGKSVRWLQLDNYDKMLDNGIKLTRKQCAAYRRLAVSLGVPPRAC